MRWICSGCRAPYGQGDNKAKLGYCPACWDLWLARCQAGVINERVERLERAQWCRRSLYPELPR